jgi:cytochrome c5
MAHIHRAPRGENGPVLVGLAKDAADPGHWSVEDHPITDADIDDFLGGRWYVNVHTPAHEAGEIRAQIGPAAPPPADTTDPTASLGALPATVSGTVTLTATADDNVGVTRVRFLLNGATEIGSDTTSPYSVSWDTTTAPNGQATLTAEAQDAAGNTGVSAPGTTMVNNATAVTLAQLQATIFGPRCSVCHTGGGASLPASMNLSSANASFNALVNVASQQKPSLRRVAPGDSAGSYLVHKLEGGPDIELARMPQGGPFLSTAEINSVRSWIDSGAPNN